MWTRSPLTYTAALAVLFIGLPPAALAQNPDSVQILTERLAEGVYALRGQGGNIGLAVGVDAVFVVDDQFAPLTPKILAAIAALTDRPVRFVLNTHWHFQYASAEYGACLASHGGILSMSRRGDCWDNAVVESFFATLEWELLMGEDFATHAAAANRALVEFINRWYNHERLHSTLDYRTPVEYEQDLLRTPRAA